MNNILEKSVKLASGMLLLHGATALAADIEHPNIIWITCEDISPYIGCYGDPIVKTPNIDALAHDGMQFQSVFTTAGVSSPSRSCIITGMYPTSQGTSHMRTLGVKPNLGIKNYSAVLPEYVRCFPEYMRQAGYYTTNCAKTDYQFIQPATVWDDCSDAAHYSRRPSKDTPFFSVFNLAITHESQLFKQSHHFKGHEDLIVKPEQVTADIPPIYMDTPKTRDAIALQLSNIQLMDYHLGEIIKELKEKGLYDNSYIIFYSDHGGALPWMKREILERGTHIPFIVKFPKGQHAGEKNNDLISSVDFAPTMLSLANIPIPEWMQGQAFLGSQKAKTPRKYVFAARDRVDETYDRVRSVRDKRFRYLYNFMPDRSKYMPVKFRTNIPMMKEYLALRDSNLLSEPLKDWFKQTKDVEELYDVENDPWELHNLAKDPAYQDKLIELRTEFRKWMDKVGDTGYMSEKEMITNWWHGKENPPKTAMPEIQKTKNGYTLSCPTRGASIAYRILNPGETIEQRDSVFEKTCSFDISYLFNHKSVAHDIKVEAPWMVYTKGQALKLRKGQRLQVNAHRIGYDPSIKVFEL